MSLELKHSTGSIGTVYGITNYAPELELLIGKTPIKTIISTDPDVEDAATFALEEHLADFLIKNWDQTLLSKDFTIYEEDGMPGQQFPTDAGPIDIFAVSKYKKRLLVIELKRGGASEVVVGQTLRYMSCVKEEIAEANQTVEGAIIALEDDRRIPWALASVPSISFYQYHVSFKLEKV